MFVEGTTQPRKYRKQIEGGVQQRICNYIRRKYPDVVFYCDAAGLNLTDTQRLKLMEQRSDEGMADLNIDEARDKLISGKLVHFHGARFEIKRDGVHIYKKDSKTLRADPYTRRYYKRGKLFIKRGDHLQEQAAYLRKMNRKGYFSRFAVGYDNLERFVDWYLGADNTTLF
jgi:hypothetical protein